MRTFIYAAIGLSFVVTMACRKDTAQDSARLEGKWELAVVEGGWVGRQDYDWGSGNTIEFKDSNYVRTFSNEDTTYQMSGKFRVFRGRSCEASAEELLIMFEDLSLSFPISYSSTTLTISPPACIADLPLYIYRRKLFN